MVLLVMVRLSSRTAFSRDPRDARASERFTVWQIHLQRTLTPVPESGSSLERVDCRLTDVVAKRPFGSRGAMEFHRRNSEVAGTGKPADCAFSLPEVR